MRWAKAAVALGFLLLVLGFGLGTDASISTTVAGQHHRCASVIPMGWLASGQPTSTRKVPDTRTPAERRLDARVAAACDPLERGARWAVWGGLGLGGLVLLAGWTALRERELDELLPGRRTSVPAGVQALRQV